ncbi:protein kinase [Chloroflexia bacterium SDU3-3]|nr:protein kinase [Chloroflexia bacterium SDU3-3]
MTMTHTCPICYLPAAAGEAYCPGCGYVFGSAPAGPPPDSGDLLLCPRCSAEQRPGARVCSACGAKLVGVDLNPGETLHHGQYIVRRLLARGGMGAIYLAADRLAFDRLVVLKVHTLEDDAADTEDRLRTEGWLLASIQQRNLPRIYAYFTHGVQRFLAMEYIDGPNLHEALSQDDEHGQRRAGSRYPLTDTLRWGAAIARTLEQLHSRRPMAIIHQDIKPSNLVLDRSSHDVFLIDFGNAKLYDPQRAQQAESFGTPGYSPPEQYQGLSEPRSDIFSLAATLYHLATDDDPSQHPFQFPQLGELGPFGDVLAQALQKEVEQRPSAALFRAQLESQLGLGGTALVTPDGQRIEDEAELVAWCRAHWESAVEWMAGALPVDIERWRGMKRAQQVRDALASAPSLRLALDAALALLDPAGYGMARPQVIFSSRALAFSRTPSAAPETLAVANTGSRYVEATLDLPPWMTASVDRLSLPAGKQVRIQLHAVPGARRTKGEVVLRAGNETLALCRVGVRR